MRENIYVLMMKYKTLTLITFPELYYGLICAHINYSTDVQVLQFIFLKKSDIFYGF